VREEGSAEKELFHLRAQPFGQVRDILAAICDSRIRDGDGDEAIIALAAFLAVLFQAKDAYQAALDDDAGKRRRVGEDEDVERISVIAAGSREKAPAIWIGEAERQGLPVGEDLEIWIVVELYCRTFR